MVQEAEKETETPSEWVERHFLIPDPRDPITGERLSPGPMRLAPHQKRIIDEALSRNPDGTLKYSTVIYSAPKKSGKSAITSAVMLYMAYHHPNSYVACVANDGKQSNDRLFAPIKTTCRLHDQYGGILQGSSPNRDELVLNNFTKIEPVPCDAAGEAGSQPIFVAFSEAWGFTSDAKKRVFTELSIPPTLYGYAMRWIETYAGFVGQSELLEQVYETGFIEGVPHPDFEDLIGDNGPVVRVNASARMFTYWDTEPRMVWQNQEYYASESQLLQPSEFERIHRNKWVSPIEGFIEESWWSACENKELPALLDGDDTPVVVGIDMAVSRDCAALVAVTRDPFNPETSVAVRAVRVFNPKKTGGVINQEQMVRPVIEDWAKRWNVVCFAYDPREMAKLAQDLTHAGVGWFKPFGQQQPRAVADKELYDMVLHHQVSWSRDTTFGDVGYRGDTNETLYKHITQAGASTKGEAYRLEKLSASTKIDAAVALSQATHVAMSLAIDNRELKESHLIDRLRKHEITVDEFSDLVRKSNANLRESMQDAG